MANGIKQHSLSRRARSQSPQIHPSSQTTTPSRRATSQSPRTHLLSQTTIPSKRTVVLYNFLVSCHGKNREAVEPWTVFNLTLKEHQSLWWLLEKESSLYNYVVGKLRFDWSPDTSTFVVRMPTTKHESFVEAVSTEIVSQLAKAGNQDNDVKVVTDRIESEGSPLIDLLYYDTERAKCPKRTPDKSFGPGNQFPLVVIEVAYSQQQKKLPRIADEYICGSSGNIKVVLGFDIGYDDQSKKATTSIWRPGTSDDGDLITEEVRNDDPFRTKEGTLVPGLGFSLRVRDLVLSTQLPDLPSRIHNQTVVHVTPEQLASFLYRVETTYELNKINQGAQEPDRKKRVREATPEEELSSRKERKISKQEVAEEESNEARDPDWSPV